MSKNAWHRQCRWLNRRKEQDKDALTFDGRPVGKPGVCRNISGPELMEIQKQFQNELAKKRSN